MSVDSGRTAFGALLRQWRDRRRVSQLDLALDAGVSARHVSFLETGRSRPSREMVLRLAERLDVPLRDRNPLLLAAGLARLHRELAGYPGGSEPAGPDAAVAVPLRLRVGGTDLAFISTVTTFGTALDVTAAELSIEAFLPADPATAEAVRALVAG